MFRESTTVSKNFSAQQVIAFWRSDFIIENSVKKSEPIEDIEDGKFLKISHEKNCFPLQATHDLWTWMRLRKGPRLLNPLTDDQFCDEYSVPILEKFHFR
jgi:hypothetical protein